MDTFAASVVTTLQERADELAARWQSRARVATPRGAAADAAPDGVDVVRAVVASLDTDARWQGEVMRLGWSGGAAARAAELSVHHVLKDTDLLLSILLTAAEEAVHAGATLSAAEAFVVARQLQRATGLYAQAAASSHQHALVRAMRARWRVLRHDLRNPIGTIRGALSLMEDESLPPETRNGPRFRAMVARNAGSLEELITAGLDDASAEALLSAPQDVSLRDVALAVRRSLRDVSRLAECEIVVDDALPVARVDEAAVELTLGTLLLAAVARARPGDVLRVAAAPPGPTERPRARRQASPTVALRVVRERVGGPVSDEGLGVDELALTSALAAEFGGRVTAVGGDFDLALPLLPWPDEPAAPPAPAAPRGSGWHPRDDVARAD